MRARSDRPKAPCAASPSLPCCGSGPNDVWAAGDNNTLLHFDGASWKPSKHGGSGTFTGLFAVSAKEAWIVADKATVLRRKLP